MQIQEASPEAAHWPADSYLQYECRVAATGERMVGFLVSRQTADGEREILNLAVDPDFRRQGIARRLLERALSSAAGEWFLEMRQSNEAARNLYLSMGFQQVGLRPAYYQDPSEWAIVMRFFS